MIMTSIAATSDKDTNIKLNEKKERYIPRIQKAKNVWRVKKVLFKKNNECESVWDNRGNTKLNQTKLQKHLYQ